MYKLAIGACVKNEEPYLEEWLEFHRMQGVEHFYLYDNESTDGTVEFLLKQPDVTLNSVGFDMCQFATYYHCCYRYRNQAEWIAFIDVDEYLFCPDGKLLPDQLAGYGSVAAVGAYMKHFGGNGHKTKPEGLTIENYTKCRAEDHVDSRHIKSIVRPGFALCPAMNPHSFITNGPTVDESMRILQGPIAPEGSNTYDRFQINHYVFRSQEEFLKKHARGRADGCVEHGTFQHNSWTDDEPFKEEHNKEEDTTILQFVDPLKERMYEEAAN